MEPAFSQPPDCAGRWIDVMSKCCQRFGNEKLAAKNEGDFSSAVKAARIGAAFFACSSAGVDRCASVKKYGFRFPTKS